MPSTEQLGKKRWRVLTFIREQTRLKLRLGAEYPYAVFTRWVSTQSAYGQFTAS